MRHPFLTATLLGLGIAIGAGSAWADGTETLGPPSIPIAGGTGIIGAGTGLADGPGFINIDVPGAVQQAVLYWGCFAPPGGRDWRPHDILLEYPGRHVPRRHNRPWIGCPGFQFALGRRSELRDWE